MQIEEFLVKRLIISLHLFIPLLVARTEESLDPYLTYILRDGGSWENMMHSGV